MIPKAKDTLGVERRHMPQVASEHYKEYLAYLKDRGVVFKNGLADPDTLKPIQKEFSKKGIDKVLGKIEKEGVDHKKRIIVSRDGFIIDGHHRWIAHRKLSIPVDIMRANVSMKRLFKLTTDFSKAIFRSNENRLVDKDEKGLERVIQRLRESGEYDLADFLLEFNRSNPMDRRKELESLRDTLENEFDDEMSRSNRKKRHNFDTISARAAATRQKLKRVEHELASLDEEFLSEMGMQFRKTGFDVVVNSANRCLELLTMLGPKLPTDMLDSIQAYKEVLAKLSKSARNRKFSITEEKWQFNKLLNALKSLLMNMSKAQKYVPSDQYDSYMAFMQTTREFMTSLRDARDELYEGYAKSTDKDDDGDGLDPVGSEDSDVDNDGDSDESDKYLKKRRMAISKKIGKKN